MGANIVILAVSPHNMRTFTRRSFLKTSTLCSFITPRLADVALGASADRETLYNGITLGSPWPPDNRYFGEHPVDLPYLADPPAVIPIDVGRQLFVDDFLIEESSLTRTFHRAQYHPANPVLRPETRWELFDEYADRTQTKPNPSAMVFSDGVFYDPADRLFKMWYMGGYQQHTCLATSRDGVEWTRPTLDRAGTNIVMTFARDSSTVWLDHEDRDRSARFKMAVFNGSHNAMVLFASPDGIKWRQVGETGATGDRSTAFWNPFRKVWVFSLRDSIAGRRRHRRYFECANFAAARWEPGAPTFWIAADSRDVIRPEYKMLPELYNLDCVAYESVLLGLFTIWHGEYTDREKVNDITVGYSRDGFHWARPSREAFIGVSETVGDWNWANVQSAGGCCMVVGDQLYFYVSGRQGEPGTDRPGLCSTGLATLRRDGFASVSDDVTVAQPARVRAARARSITTRPVRFSGAHLFVNADVAGELRVEMLDREGHVIEPYTTAQAIPVRGNGTRLPVAWATRSTLRELAGEVVRFRFTIDRGRLFAFWVSPTSAGHSMGYVGAGGPGFARSLDSGA